MGVPAGLFPTISASLLATVLTAPDRSTRVSVLARAHKNRSPCIEPLLHLRERGSHARILEGSKASYDCRTIGLRRRLDGIAWSFGDSQLRHQRSHRVGRGRVFLAAAEFGNATRATHSS